MHSRREFIKKIMVGIAGFPYIPKAFAATSPFRKPLEEAKATVFRSVGGDPVENIRWIHDMLGGVDRLIGKDDVVVIKPNLQWWNQGAPNIAAINRLVALIFNRPGGFKGEVVIAENIHRGREPWKHAGWSNTFDRNSDDTQLSNYNELVASLKKNYGNQFTSFHMINAKDGGRRVYNPSEGSGYVFCDGTGGVALNKFDNGASGDHYREVIMTYPIISTDKGTVIDFKNGIWEKGSYTQQPLKFINLSALNHHSYWCAVTSSVKNYLGISDLSGGPDPHNDGKLTEKYYNFHSFPFDKWAPGPKLGMIGAEIGVFLNTIRKADLNITTAEWVGLASRTEPPVARTQAVLASTDPVALDFHASKYLVYPNSKIKFHDPEYEEGPLHQYLKACAEYGNCVFDEQYVDIKSYDHRLGRMQRDDELVVKGDITWGRDVKTLLKYFSFRTGIYKLMI